MAPSTRNMEKEAEDQAKVTSNNARIVKMNQAKKKMSRLQTKLECAIGQLKGSFINYKDAYLNNPLKTSRSQNLVGQDH